jgi:hypothetical protein
MCEFGSRVAVLVFNQLGSFPVVTALHLSQNAPFVASPLSFNLLSLVSYFKEGFCKCPSILLPLLRKKFCRGGDTTKHMRSAKVTDRAFCQQTLSEFDYGLVSQ